MYGVSKTKGINIKQVSICMKIRIYTVKNPYIRHIKLLLRYYVDDIFIVWSDIVDDFYQLVALLNDTNHMNTSFTSKFRGNRLEFLDVLVSIGDGKLDTTGYRYSNKFCSPLRAFILSIMKRAIPYGQFMGQSVESDVHYFSY